MNRHPTNGTFELTGRCNLGCKMCLVRVDQARIRELGLRERTAEEWIDMARQATDAGTLGLLLTGGEIMLRPDFCEIYEAIAQMGFLLTIYTNATLVTEPIMQVLRKYPPHKIGVTMYGASNETYTRLCGCADGYDRFLDGVRQLTSLPSLFDIRTTIVKDNLADLPAMREYTRKTFGEEQVLHVSRIIWNSIRGAVTDPCTCRLSAEENAKLSYEWLFDIQERIAQGTYVPPKEKLTLHRAPVPAGTSLFSSCDAGTFEYTIAWNGRMYACEIAGQGYTEPFETSLLEAWDALPAQYPQSRSNPKCAACAYSVVCETCPASRMAETGDWFGAPDYACQEAQTIYQLLQTMHLIEEE